MPLYHTCWIFNIIFIAGLLDSTVLQCIKLYIFLVRFEYCHMLFVFFVHVAPSLWPLSPAPDHFSWANFFSSAPQTCLPLAVHRYSQTSPPFLIIWLLHSFTHLFQFHISTAATGASLLSPPAPHSIITLHYIYQSIYTHIKYVVPCQFVMLLWASSISACCLVFACVELFSSFDPLSISGTPHLPIQTL